ncbi:sugar transferase [Porphyromonas levii]|uniref:sugar transferase n=1 Tax=Porphyromonas levii TaxID=28114 RepID=UPI001B8CA127|nr:sugar transferase [Porphyromonas levii]MBR8769065.1 hypothetical protein [Porphyromonas levii]
MIRFFDFVFSFLGLVFLLPILLLLFIIGLFDTGSPLFIQKRVGKDQKPFYLVKFRTMRKGSAQVATHLANKNAVTKYGAFLRRTKLDELPQLWNVLIGDMSFVGPRPNLYNQTDLIEQRQVRDVYDYLPGITGLAQIQEIDMSTPELLAQTDAEMLEKLNLRGYFFYIFVTISGRGQGDRIKG